MSRNPKWMRPPFGGRIQHIGGIEPVSACGRPGRGRRGGWRRGLLGRHGGRSRPRRGSGLFLRRGGFPGRRGRPGGLQFDKDRVWHEARGIGIAAISRSHHPHRHGLRLVAGKREAHREFVGCRRQRARGSAGLSQRCLGLGPGRLGLELHGGCRGRRLHEARRIKLHPARQARASSKAQGAGCNCDNSFHDDYRPLMQPHGRVTLTKGAVRERPSNGNVPRRPAAVGNNTPPNVRQVQ
jgi:hypothetical protein